jgi:hypothetical protein
MFISVQSASSIVGANKIRFSIRGKLASLILHDRLLAEV